ncbi:MAG TPA: hypothetical protein VNZ43_14415 [Sphingomonadaceae bacterium]|nr:hypothetical protein [Sphingomonadaceae bacterium]
MTKRDFLKAGAATTLTALMTAPALASFSRRIAVVQTGLPGADAFARRERAAGATILEAKGDPVRWHVRVLRPALGRAEVVGYTDAAHAILLEGSLREEGYVRSGPQRRSGRALLWQAAPRAA